MQNTETHVRENIARSIRVRLVRQSHGNDLFEAQWSGPNPGVGFPTWNDMEECRSKAKGYIMTELDL
jgi:hypothetical protein